MSGIDVHATTAVLERTNLKLSSDGTFESENVCVIVVKLKRENKSSKTSLTAV